MRVETDLSWRLPSRLSIWVRAGRLHQWAKDLLLALPALAAHLAPEPRVVWSLVVGSLSFSLLASAVYLVNAIEDLEHDRLHPTKRERRSARPFASLTLTSTTKPLWFSIRTCAACASRYPTPLLFRASRASGSVRDRCVRLLRFSPRKFTSDCPGHRRPIHR